MVKKSVEKGWNYVKKFWDYIWHDDSAMSYVVNLVFAFVVIKFILFPTLGFFLNNDYPIVAIVSGSMEHKVVDGKVCDNYNAGKDRSLDFEDFWVHCGAYYKSNFNLTKEEFVDFEYKNGLNIGDVMLLYGQDYSKIDIGEVLVFVPNDKVWFASHGPVIHRVVDKWQDETGKYHFQTKGDHNPVSAMNFEEDILQENVIGVSILRVPYIGYVKIGIFKVAEYVANMFTSAIGG